jgi:glycosyltransferase involved in cell wall biosynthesis
LFQLFKIINPVWFYNLPTKIGDGIQWVDYRKLDVKLYEAIDFCEDYEDPKVKVFDASYQLLIGGLINNNKSKILINRQSYYPKSLRDQYFFLRRFNKPIWVYFVFLIRLLSLNNPIKEIKGFLGTNIKKTPDKSGYVFLNEKFEIFKSSLLLKNPKISIIIPTLNRYTELNDILIDLEFQSYKNFEIIIIDQSDEFDASFYKKFNFHINLIRQKSKALWRARNQAIKKSIGEYILLLDDDSRVSNNWIEQHLKCIDYFKSEISAGASLSGDGNFVSEKENYFRWGDKLDTGNVMLKRDVFYKCGLFDTKFEKMRMGDHEYGIRCYINDYKIVHNPKALRLHSKAPTGGLRVFGHWDGLRGINFFISRPIPSILYLFRKYWGNKSTLYFLLKTLPLTITFFKYKNKKSGKIISLLLFIIFLPIILLQVIKSWIKSSSLLKSVDNIEYLDSKNSEE